ncbi:MAG: hypothetical protein IPL73_02945 [Candidatus Obscuribacter sp.]|nr:hypothetical protein [Candidatus Obscuribacter sp.]
MLDFFMLEPIFGFAVIGLLVLALVVWFKSPAQAALPRPAMKMTLVCPVLPPLPVVTKSTSLMTTGLPLVTLMTTPPALRSVMSMVPLPV